MTNRIAATAYMGMAALKEDCVFSTSPAPTRVRRRMALVIGSRRSDVPLRSKNGERSTRTPSATRPPATIPGDQVRLDCARIARMRAAIARDGRSSQRIPRPAWSSRERAVESSGITVESTVRASTRPRRVGSDRSRRSPGRSRSRIGPGFRSPRSRGGCREPCGLAC